MTPTQKGRRSDALYMDTRATHRRQLCDMVVNREADIEDLKEEMYGLQCDIGRLENENAKLRNEVDNLMDFEHLTSVAVAYAGCDECGEYKQTMLRLFAENAKLRKIARKMWKPFCWAQSGYEVCLSDEEDREIRDLARGLGIVAAEEEE